MIAILATSYSRTLRRCVIEGECSSALRLEVSTFRPLYSCALLEKFTFNLYGRKPIKMLDADLETMATSWPKLKVLRMTQNRSSPNPVATTLRGLSSFAERCTDLIEVMINVNGTIPSISPNHSPSSLRNLHLLNSPGGSAEGIVAFLNQTFPRLRQLDAYESSSKEGTEWEEVMDRLPHRQRWPAGDRHLPEQDSLLD